jgi:PHP family Zn ribbon phosphoesterase
LEDLYLAEQRLIAIRAGKSKTVPLEEVMKRYGWKVELDAAAERKFSKLDPQIARRLLAFLQGRVAVLDDPRSIGEALKGSKSGEFWK